MGACEPGVSEHPMSNSTKFCVHVVRGRGSVIQAVKLKHVVYTSGLWSVDDVIFFQKPVL